MFDLIEEAKKYGVENLLFIVGMSPLHKILGVTFTRSSDELTPVPAVIDEEKDKLSANYKVTLKSMYELFGSERFYISDLNSMIRDGHVKVYSIIKVTQ